MYFGPTPRASMRKQKKVLIFYWPEWMETQRPTSPPPTRQQTRLSESEIDKCASWHFHLHLSSSAGGWLGSLDLPCCCWWPGVCRLPRTKVSEQTSAFIWYETPSLSEENLNTGNAVDLQFRLNWFLWSEGSMFHLNLLRFLDPFWVFACSCKRCRCVGETHSPERKLHLCRQKPQCGSLLLLLTLSIKATAFTLFQSCQDYFQENSCQVFLKINFSSKYFKLLLVPSS